MRAVKSRWSLGVCALLASGCEPEVLVASATLEVEPGAIDFGKVPTGQTRSVGLRLINTSARAPLKLSRVALAEGSAPVFAVGEVPEEILPGAEATVVVTYTPDDPLPDAGHVEIVSNALGAPLLRVPLSSARTSPRIAIDPPQLDLGSIHGAGRASASLRLRSVGDGTLEVRRVSLRTGGFHGEACAQDADCHEGRCRPSTSGPICALPCGPSGACPAGYTCADEADGDQSCREAGGTRPPLAVRGFRLLGDDLARAVALQPGVTQLLEVEYAPGAADRGGAQVVVESSDEDRGFFVVPLLGRPDNLPPVAVAELAAPLPDPVGPGARIEVTGARSHDPEGEAITHRWRFSLRPEGSRATFADPDAEATSFVVDRPGTYVAALEVRDTSGLTSSNDARITVEAIAGRDVRVELRWDRPGTDLDLHLLAPGAVPGSAGDCFFENPAPDWPPAGPEGDPSFEGSGAEERIAISGAAPGVYTLFVRVVAPSPEGPSTARLRVLFGEVEVFARDAVLPLDAETWDVATLSWPSGRITALDTIR